MYRRVLAVLSGLLLLIVAPAPVRAAPPMTGAVLGVVLDQSRPAAGITVSLWHLGPSRTVDTATDQAGHFRFSSVLPGDYYLVYKTPGGGMTQYSESFTVAAGQVVREKEFIEPHGALAGRIRTDHGAPAGGAEVVLDYPRTNISTRTDAQGRFLLDYVPPRDSYKVYVQRKPDGAPSQYVPRVRSWAESPFVSIAAGQVVRIEERLLPMGVIEGTFTGPDGPLDGSVGARAQSSAVSFHIGADGSYRLYVWPGDYRLQFDHDDREQWAPGAVDEADGEVFGVEADEVVRHDERLLADGTIGGRLLDYTGEPVAGPVTVELTSRNYATTTATTDSAGNWSAIAFPGDYWVRFRYANRSLRLDETYRVLPGRRATVPEQRLALPGDLEIGVTVDGEPAQAFCVTLNVSSVGASDLWQCTEDGTVLFTEMTPADYYWQVSVSPDSWDGRFVTVVPGRLTTTTLAVTKAES